MSVHQLKDGRWFVKHYQDGKEKRRYFGRDGQQAAVDFNASLGLGRTRRRSRGPSFGDLTMDWLKAKRGQIADTSWYFSAKKFESKILPNLGHIQAANITPVIIDKWVAKRLQSVKRTTVHRDLSDIIAVLNFAVSRGRLTANPLAGYRKPTRDDEIITPPTTEEINAILAHAAEHLKRVIVISYFTGLRPGASELFGLRYKDVDLAGGTITIQSAKKGGLRYRELPLHRDFKKALQGWVRVDGLDREKYLISYNGQPVKSVKTAWKHAKERAGITRRLRLYDLRHHFATALLTGGTDLKTVSAAIGHKDAGTTLRVYAHTATDVLRDAIDRLPGLVTKQHSDHKKENIIKLKQ